MKITSCSSEEPKDKEMKDAEMRCILTGLNAMEKLYKADKIKF